MNDLKLNTSHDLVFEDGDVILLNSESLVATQAIKINLLTLRGEWWLNLTLGVPYLQDILRKGASQPFVDAVFRQAIEDSYNISRVVEFQSQVDADRRYTITSMRALITDGVIVSITNQTI